MIDIRGGPNNWVGWGLIKKEMGKILLAHKQCLINPNEQIVG